MHSRAFSGPTTFSRALSVHPLRVPTMQRYVDYSNTNSNLNPDPNLNIQGGSKTEPFLKCITLLYNDIGRHSIYENVQLFIRSKNDIVNTAVFKYSLHKVRETTLH